jgi:hypothetical protein
VQPPPQQLLQQQRAQQLLSRPSRGQLGSNQQQQAGQQQGGTRKRLLLDDEDPKMAAFDELEVQVGQGMCAFLCMQGLMFQLLLSGSKLCAALQADGCCRH